MAKGSTKSKQADGSSGLDDQGESYQPTPEFNEDITTDDTNIDESSNLAEDTPANTEAPEKKRPHHRIWQWYKTHKKVSIPLSILAVAVILASVPFTRFAIAGLVVKQNYSVKVVDSQSGKPVSSALITLGGKSAKTDNKGLATIKAKVGSAKVTVVKKYFKSAGLNVTVPIMKQKTVPQVKVVATGRQVPVTVINRITQKPVANAKIAALGAEAKTDAKGQTILVLPADKTEVVATIAAGKYNESEYKIRVTAEKIVENTFSLTPAGKLYFLSNLGGKLDVVSTNLDGSNRQVVLAGTGNEDRNDTILLSTTDWKYLALKSKRDGGENAKLFLINTNTNKTSVMDEGDAYFQPVGWSGHFFTYSVSRNKVKSFEPKKTALKSFSAETNHIATLDESEAEGNENDFVYQNFYNTYLVGDELVYTTSWTASYPYTASKARLNGKSVAINGVKLEGKGQKVYKSFDATAYDYIDSNVYEPNSVRYQIATSDKVEYYEFEDSQVKPLNISNDQYVQAYPRHLFSPGNDHTLWADLRDGKNAIFVGDKDGENEKQIASLGDKSQGFGWYTETYVLISENDSELYIMPSEGLAKGQRPLKISDYYKPPYQIRGYGGGYGL